MAWTAPRTWVDSELVTASLMNTHVRDNLLYLLTPNYFNISSTSDYTTTSTSVVTVNAALSTSITMNGGHLLVGANFEHSITGAGAYSATIYITVGASNYTIFSGYDGNDRMYAAALIVPAPAAGATTVSLRWLVSNASGTATMSGAPFPIRFWGIEI